MNISGLSGPSSPQQLKAMTETQINDKPPKDFQAELNKAKENQTENKHEELREAADQFETYFMKEMLSAMRDTIPEGGLLEEGHGRDIYEGMLDDAYADKMTEAGGIGLSDKIYDNMIRYI